VDGLEKNYCERYFFPTLSNTGQPRLPNQPII
jgi:hypothetical protein